MNKMVIKRIGKLMGVLFLCASSFCGFGNGIVSHGAEEDSTTVHIYKGAYDSKPSDTQNTGEKDEAWHTDKGGRPLKDAGFTAYDVSKKFYELAAANPTQSVEQIRDTIKGMTAEEAGGSKVGEEQKTNNLGHTSFNLPKKVLVDGKSKDAVYLIMETSQPADVTVKSDNLVVVFPVYKLNPDGTPTDEVLKEVYLYPKNVQKDDLQVKKEKELKDDFTVGEPIDFTISFNVPTGIAGLRNNDPANPLYRYTEFFLRDESEGNLHYLDDQGLHVKNSDGTLTPITDVDYSVVADPNGTPDNAGYSNIFHVFFNDANDLNTTAPNNSALAKYAGKTLVFKYRMYLDENTTPDEWIDNQATLKYQNNPSGGLEELPWSGDDVITYGRRFKKIDQDNQSSLAGAEFIVKRKNDGKTEYMISKATPTTPSRWSENKADALVLTSADNTGIFTVSGLEATVSHDSDGNALKLETKEDSKSIGDPTHPATVGKALVQYWLEEVKAPSNKYVTLANDIDFTVDYGTYKETTKVGSETTVGNKRKGILPGTGGAGIVAIIGIGIVAALGAAYYFKGGNKKSQA